MRLLTAAGATTMVVDYRRTPPALAGYTRAGMTARHGLRRSEAAAAVLADADDERILAAMPTHPALIDRPLVETARGIVLARPAERMRTIL